MSSTDGYCSTLAFSPGELGQVYTGPRPTYNHPVVSTISLPTSSAQSTPVPTPTATASPSLTKASPVPVPPSHPSPAPFVMRPGSPARSNSQSSIATMASVQTSGFQNNNNATPTMGHVPLVTATNSGPPIAVPPMSTPPQTPASGHGGHHSATNSVSGSVLGKRDASATSESEREDTKSKKRRIAPTLVGPSGSTEPPKEEEKS